MLNIRHLGLKAYNTVWEDMKLFTSDRHEKTIDELWLVEHLPVYTQGQAGKAEHLLHATAIPVVKSDRGGQITYHGPGQLVAYVLIDIRRQHMGIRHFVAQLERVLIQLLKHYDIAGQIRCGAPGVYVNEKKIASIGLRVKNGCTYHGISLNVAMDLKPFSNINPCGYASLQMTQIQDFITEINFKSVEKQFTQDFLTHFDSLHPLNL